MLLVADESVDFGIIRVLREKKFNVISISENYPGIKDLHVLAIANENHCLLITEDKDFGELTYRLNMQHCGIFLIRLNDVPRSERITRVASAIEKYSDELINSFAVINSSGLRIKKGI